MLGNIIFLFAVIPILVGWKFLPKWLTILSFILVAGNIKQPELVPVWATLLLSNQFLGVFLLWVGLMGKSLVKKFSDWIFFGGDRSKMGAFFI